MSVSFYYRGRWAMAAALKQLNLNKGDKVLIQAYTCLAVPQGISALGLIPVIIDTDERSLFMSEIELENKLRKNDIKCVVIQHTFGFLAPKSLYDLCVKHNVFIIEDCAHLVLGYDKFIDPGYKSRFRFYSMEWGKPIPVGIGGVLETDDVSVRLESTNINLIKYLKIELQYIGFKMFYKPSLYFLLKNIFSFLTKLNLLEGNNIDIKSLKFNQKELNFKISPFVRRRYEKYIKKYESNDFQEFNKVKHIANILNKELNLQFFRNIDLERSLPLRFPVWVKDKQMVLSKASKLGIPLGDWYSTPVDPLDIEILNELNWSDTSLYNARDLSEHVVTIPLNTRQSLKDIEKIIQFLTEVK